MDHFDVIVVGAGLSGIGAACHLRRECPDKSFVILEARDAIGGTWDLFRYPGVRSDSDMHTLGYNFKPWTAAKAIADGPSILRYVQDAAREYGVDKHIRFKHRVRSAEWSTADARWSVDVECEDTQARTSITGAILFMCGGYYSYDEPYKPDFVGVDRFSGTVVHPQFWPQDLVYAGKRVAVIGSGATAMTLVPAMAQSAAHVTMVQRSPTYVISAPSQDGIANWLSRLLPERSAYAVTRMKNIYRDLYFYHRTRVAPEKIKAYLLGLVRTALGQDYDVNKHFTPKYNPWDQRLCLIPDDDLFNAISSGCASVVTDTIECFTERGLKLASGEEVEADIVVTATGLQLCVLSDVDLVVDGQRVDLTETFAYKGMMYSDVPNLVQTFGYINASWTLRADLTAQYVCRLLQRMDALGMRQCTPRLRPSDETMRARPWIDDFPAGYMQRMMHRFPKQGDRDPWCHTQNYAKDRKLVRRAPVDDDVLQFSNPPRERAGLPVEPSQSDAA